MILAIVAAEVAFWVFIFAGLTVRYVLGIRGLGTVLLACTPLIDLALLVFIVVDLRSGAIAHWTHGLGAVYLGFTVVYGRRIVRWADRKFAARREGVASERKEKLYGSEKARYEWKETFKWWGACTLSILILVFCAFISQEASVFIAWIARMVVVAVVATIVPITYSIWPKAAPPAKPQELRS